MRVGIVGGGPTGLFTGWKLAEDDIEVVVYEEHKEIGVPNHCAGVISIPTLLSSGVSPTRVVSAELRGLRLGIPDKIELEYVGERVKAVVIDRSAFDRELARKLLFAGGEISLHNKASIEAGRDATLSTDKGREEFDLLIDAGGARSYIRNWGMNPHVLLGLQFDVAAEDYDARMAEVWIDKVRNPDFFFWCNPIGNDLIRIGTAASKKDIDEALRSFARWRFGKVRILGITSGLLILSGYRKSFVEGRVVYVGDSAGQTKPTTGGGLRYGLSAAQEVAVAIVENLRNGKPLTSYGKGWRRRWKRDVDAQKIARRIFLGLNEKSLIRTLEALRRVELFPMMVSQGDMDLQISLIQVVKGHKGLVRLGLELAGGAFMELLGNF